MIDSLQLAKNDLRQGWKTPDGTKCGCCGQKVKLYKRKIYGVPAVELIKLYRLNIPSPGVFHHISEFCQAVPVVSKLLFWDLVEEKMNEDSTKRTSGFWRITSKGIRFAEGKYDVLKYAYVFNNRALEYSVERQSIHEALGKDFNYPELMGYLI